MMALSKAFWYTLPRAITLAFAPVLRESKKQINTSRNLGCQLHPGFGRLCMGGISRRFLCEMDSFMMLLPILCLLNNS